MEKKEINKVDFLEQVISIMKNSYGIKYFSEPKFIEGLKQLLRDTPPLIDSLQPVENAVSESKLLKDAESYFDLLRQKGFLPDEIPPEGELF